MKVDHSKISFKNKLSSTVKHYLNRAYIICYLPVEQIYQEEINSEGRYTRHISDTTHIRYLKGNKEEYITYLNKSNQPEHSPENFDKLRDNFDYLGKGRESEYILCEKRGDKYFIFDGAHRASLLYYKGVKKILCAVMCNDNQFERYFYDFKDFWQSWYQPIKIDNFIINERTYPNYIERPDYLTNGERGFSKYIKTIKPYINFTNKTILDFGCNSGIIDIAIIDSGAKSIIGYDRDINIDQPTNTYIKQDYVQQAWFVKNLYTLFYGKKYSNLKYDYIDLNNLYQLNQACSLNSPDIIMSLCVIYHFKEMNEIIQIFSRYTNKIVLQTNLGHGGSLGKYASIEHHLKCLESLKGQIKVFKDHIKYPLIIWEKK